MEKSVFIDVDKDKVYFQTVFYKGYELPEPLFKMGLEYDFIILFSDEYLFNEDNRLMQDRLQEFFKRLTDEVYIASDYFKNSESYPTIKFKTYLTFDGLLSRLEEPLRSDLATNWTNDYFYDENGQWGIYHLHDVFFLIVGYSPDLQSVVEEVFLGYLPNERSCDFFFTGLTQYMNEEDKQSFITESIRNNPKLARVKVYSFT